MTDQTSPTAGTPTGPPPGWYDDPSGSGRQRWYDGTQWTEHFQSVPAPQPVRAQPQSSMGPMTSASLNVKREVTYVRQQKGHSLTLWIILSLFFLFPVIWVIYFSTSPNHYWHA